MKIKDPQLLVESIEEILNPFQHIKIPPISFFGKTVREASTKENEKTKAIMSDIISTKNMSLYQDNDTVNCIAILRELFHHYQLNIKDPAQDALTNTILKFIAKQLGISRRNFAYKNPDKSVRTTLSKIEGGHPIVKTLNDLEEKELTELSNTCLYLMTDDPKKLLGNIQNLLKDFMQDKSIKILNTEILGIYDANENIEIPALKCIEMYRKLFSYYQGITLAEGKEKFTAATAKFFQQELNVPAILINVFENNARKYFFIELLYGETSAVKAQKVRKHPIAVAIANLEGKLLSAENQNDNLQTPTKSNENNSDLRRRSTCTPN